jgi:hypothetical protein
VDQRTRRLFVLVLVIVIAVTGGAALILGSTAGTGSGDPFGDPSGDPSGGPAGPPGTTAIAGVIVAVDSAGLGSVRSFTLRRAGGETIEFRLDRLANAAEFPPGHLAEHQASAEPVRVWSIESGGAHYAIVLEDAPG